MNGSFLIAESILGRGKLFHSMAAPHGGLALGLKLRQGRCVPLIHKHAGQVTATTLHEDTAAL